VFASQGTAVILWWRGEGAFHDLAEVTSPHAGSHTLPEFSDLLRTYASAPVRLAAAVRGLTDVQCDEPRIIGPHSVRQAVARGADAELLFAMRARFVMAEPGADLPVADADAWADAVGPIVELDHSVGVFRALREQGTALWRAVPDAMWLHNGRTPDGAVRSLAVLFTEAVYAGEQLIDAILTERRRRSW
jgi:hypothetical protein